MTKQLSDIFKRSIYLSHAFIWTAGNKNPIKIRLDTTFPEVKIIFVLLFNDADDDANKTEKISHTYNPANICWSWRHLARRLEDLLEDEKLLR